MLYVGISLIVLVFGIIFIPKIVDRITSDDVTREGSRSRNVSIKITDNTKLAFLTINGQPKKVPDFTFINQDGNTISNKDYDGKVYLVEFFFTTCPTICPKMSSNLVQIQDYFKGMEGFGVASITINPKIDTPEVLQQYAKNMGITHKNWHLLTGKSKDIVYDLSNKGFKLYVGKGEEDHGGFEHSGLFALVDKNGYIRSRKDEFGNPIMYYRALEEQTFPDQIKELKEDIKLLLNE